jgi:hypothetical protein
MLCCLALSIRDTRPKAATESKWPIVLKYTELPQQTSKLCQMFTLSLEVSCLMFLWSYLLMASIRDAIPCLVQVLVSHYLEHGTLPPRSRMACIQIYFKHSLSSVYKNALACTASSTILAIANMTTFVQGVQAVTKTTGLKRRNYTHWRTIALANAPTR